MKTEHTIAIGLILLGLALLGTATLTNLGNNTAEGLSKTLFPNNNSSSTLAYETFNKVVIPEYTIGALLILAGVAIGWFTRSKPEPAYTY